MSLPNLLPGLLDKQVEFFGASEDVLAIHDGSVYQYHKFHQWKIDLVEKHIAENPEIVKEVNKKPLDFDGDFLKKYIYYVFGRLNFTPDIDLDGTLNEEFYVCLNHGQRLSDREVDILTMIVKQDKEISDTAFISNHTVNTHLQNIRHKSGLRSKPELVLEAKNEGLI